MNPFTTLKNLSPFHFTFFFNLSYEPFSSLDFSNQTNHIFWQWTWMVALPDAVPLCQLAQWLPAICGCVGNPKKRAESVKNWWIFSTRCGHAFTTVSFERALTWSQGWRMIRRLSHNYCETIRTVSCFFILWRYNRWLRRNKENKLSIYRAVPGVPMTQIICGVSLSKTLCYGAFRNIFFCYDGRGEGGGEAYVWPVDHL